MVQSAASAHELIRKVINGEGLRAKSKLVKIGEAAVRPIMDAMIGDHGRLGDSLPELLDVLKRIAKDDVTGVCGALKQSHPAQGLAVWAVGHGAVKGGTVNPKAQATLKRHSRNRDPGVRAVAEYHLGRIETKKAKKVPAKKRVATRK